MPAVDAIGGNKKSFSAAELDHVPRYIAPEDDHPAAAAAPSQNRPLSAAWQPNELASFSGAEWVPPAVAHEEVAAYVPPKSASAEPKGSPRNLIIAVAGVALVAGLGFGVSKALAPDKVKVIAEPTTVVTTPKASSAARTPTVPARPANPAQTPASASATAPTPPGSTTTPMQISPASSDADPFVPAKDTELTTPPPGVRRAERNIILLNGRGMVLAGDYGVVVADGRLPVPGDAQSVALAVDLDPESLRKAPNILIDGTLIHHVAGTTTIDRLDKVQAFASGLQRAAMEKFSSDGSFVADVWYTDESLVAVILRSPKHPDWALSVAYPTSLRPADPTGGIIISPAQPGPLDAIAAGEPATTVPTP